MSTSDLLASLLGLGTGVGGYFIGNNAIGNASNQQQAALQNAQNAITSSTAQAIGNVQPWINTGSQANANLSALLQPGGALYNTAGFTASGLPNVGTLNLSGFNPSQSEIQSAIQPGLDWTLNQGVAAINAANASKGLLGSGGEAKELMEYGQGVGNQYRQQAYENLLKQYQTGVSAEQANWQSRYALSDQSFNQQLAQYQTGEAAEQQLYNMLYGVSGQGLQAGNTAAQATIGMGNSLANLLTQSGNVGAAETMGKANNKSDLLSKLGNLFGGSGGVLDKLTGKSTGTQFPGFPEMTNDQVNSMLDGIISGTGASLDSGGGGDINSLLADYFGGGYSGQIDQLGYNPGVTDLLGNLVYPGTSGLDALLQDPYSSGNWLDSFAPQTDMDWFGSDPSMNFSGSSDMFNSQPQQQDPNLGVLQYYMDMVGGGGYSQDSLYDFDAIANGGLYNIAGDDFDFDFSTMW